MPLPRDLRRAYDAARKEQDQRNEAAEQAYFDRLTAMEEQKRAQAKADQAEADRLAEQAARVLSGADEPDAVSGQKALHGAPENKAAHPKTRKGRGK